VIFTSQMKDKIKHQFALWVFQVVITYPQLQHKANLSFWGAWKFIHSGILFLWRYEFLEVDSWFS
jgi:hypothetical protein